jgi:argininosuccinate synthase
VRLKLYKGSARVVGRKSPAPTASIRKRHVTFEDDAGAYDQKDAAGLHQAECAAPAAAGGWGG